MSTEQNKATARRWFLDIIAQGQLAVADEVFAANHIIHDPHAPPGGWPNGPEGLKTVASVFGGGFGDWNITLEDQIAEGDKVTIRWTSRGTHTGEFQGMPPTGRQMTMTAMTLARIANGKIVEAWTETDTLGMLQQLGAIPAPAN